MTIRIHSMIKELLQQHGYSWQTLMDELGMSKDDIFTLLSHQAFTVNDQENLNKLSSLYKITIADNGSEQKKPNLYFI